MQNVFQVAEIALKSGKQWYVIGRALEDIALGDVLYAIMRDKNGDSMENISSEFVVSKILIYNRSMDFVSKGWTAGIYLQGEGNHQMANITMLAKDEQNY